MENIIVESYVAVLGSTIKRTASNVHTPLSISSCLSEISCLMFPAILALTPYSVTRLTALMPQIG